MNFLVVGVLVSGNIRTSTGMLHLEGMNIRVGYHLMYLIPHPSKRDGVGGGRGIIDYVALPLLEGNVIALTSSGLEIAAGH